MANKKAIEKIVVNNYGLATYIKFLGYEMGVEMTETGLCCLVAYVTKEQFDDARDRYFDSDFKKFDDCSRALRDLRNKLCCPRN